MTNPTEKELREMPDYIINYMAPMQCGELYRAEAVRRYIEKQNRTKDIGNE